MNNLLSYCGLVVARISASEKEIPVHIITNVNMICESENIPLSFEKDLFPVSKCRCIAYLTVVIFSSDIDLSNLQKFASVNCQNFLINGILLPKLF